MKRTRASLANGPMIPTIPHIGGSLTRPLRGACLGIWREPRWLGEAADARRAAPAVVGSTVKPRNAADAPHPANPKVPGRFPLNRGGADVVGLCPNEEATTTSEGKSAAVAATPNTQTGS